MVFRYVYKRKVGDRVTEDVLESDMLIPNALGRKVTDVVGENPNKLVDSLGCPLSGFNDARDEARIVSIEENGELVDEIAEEFVFQIQRDGGDIAQLDVGIDEVSTALDGVVVVDSEFHVENGLNYRPRQYKVKEIQGPEPDPKTGKRVFRVLI